MDSTVSAHAVYHILRMGVHINENTLKSLNGIWNLFMDYINVFSNIICNEILNFLPSI